jgi:hypothetical protein
MRRLTDTDLLKWDPFGSLTPSSPSTKASVCQRLVTHDILAIHHSRTGPHTVILLTTTSSRLATASINAQTHLRWVFGQLIDITDTTYQNIEQVRDLHFRHRDKKNFRKNFRNYSAAWDLEIEYSGARCNRGKMRHLILLIFLPARVL